MFSVVIPAFHNGHEQNQWEFVLSNFKPDKMYMWRAAPGDSEIRGAARIQNISDIAHEGRIVVLAPYNGRNIQGDIPLPDYDHPEDAIYVVGSNHVTIEAEDLGNLQYDKVYIPTDSQHDMYSFVAVAVALYDRKVKHG